MTMFFPSCTNNTFNQLFINIFVVFFSLNQPPIHHFVQNETMTTFWALLNMHGTSQNSKCCSFGPGCNVLAFLILLRMVE